MAGQRRTPALWDGRKAAGLGLYYTSYFVPNFTDYQSDLGQKVTYIEELAIMPMADELHDN